MHCTLYSPSCFFSLFTEVSLTVFIVNCTTEQDGHRSPGCVTSIAFIVVVITLWQPTVHFTALCTFAVQNGLYLLDCQSIVFCTLFYHISSHNTFHAPSSLCLYYRIVILFASLLLLCVNAMTHGTINNDVLYTRCYTTY